MECSTVSVSCDEYSQTLSCKIVKAKKPHKCHECYRVIQPGEKYEIYVGVMDEIFTNKTCSDCLSVRDEFFKDGYEFGGIWEYMHEHIRECGYDISESAIESLTPRARARVCDDIQGGWDDKE